MVVVVPVVVSVCDGNERRLSKNRGAKKPKRYAKKKTKTKINDDSAFEIGGNYYKWSPGSLLLYERYLTINNYEDQQRPRFEFSPKKKKFNFFQIYPSILLDRFLMQIFIYFFCSKSGHFRCRNTVNSVVLIFPKIRVTRAFVRDINTRRYIAKNVRKKKKIRFTVLS